MDKRIEKTKKVIREAFLELRKSSSPERISVKELCDLACINKSTFYSHYENIHELSDAIEHDLVLSIVSSIPKDLDYNLSNPGLFTREVTIAFSKHLPEIQTVFSGKSRTHLAVHLETIIKQLIFSRYPEYEHDSEKNILLSYCIHGAYNASLSNPGADLATILRTLDRIVTTLKPMF